MPRTIILKITRSDKDAAHLRELLGSSKSAKKCVYVGTYSDRFILCHEKQGGKYVYFAVDMISGKFSRIHESSFEFSESALVREIGKYLVKAVKYTGCFNRAMGGGQTHKTVWSNHSVL